VSLVPGAEQALLPIGVSQWQSAAYFFREASQRIGLNL